MNYFAYDIHNLFSAYNLINIVPSQVNLANYDHWPHAMKFPKITTWEPIIVVSRVIG